MRPWFPALAPATAAGLLARACLKTHDRTPSEDGETATRGVTPVAVSATDDFRSASCLTAARRTPPCDGENRSGDSFRQGVYGPPKESAQPCAALIYGQMCRAF